MWFLYLIVKLDDAVRFADGLRGAMIFLTFLGLVVNISIAIIPSSRDKESEDNRNRIKLGLIWSGWIYKFCGIIFILSSLFVVLVPSTKQMAFIYITPKILNNKQIQGISKNTLSLLHNKADQYLRESILDLKEVEKKLTTDGHNQMMLPEHEGEE